MVEPERLQIKILRMRIARWIRKATNTHSEYVILIACPQQQWLRQRSSMLRHMYIIPHVSLDFAIVPRTLFTTAAECATTPPKSAPVTEQLATLNK